MFFFSDIKKPSCLFAIARYCTLVAPDLVIRELAIGHDLTKLAMIARSANLYRYEISQVLTPFFERDLKVKGEHEVIALAQVMYRRGRPFTLILDDRAARKFAEKNFPGLRKSTTGTMGFIVKCYKNCAIFTQKQTVEILCDMKLSEFRVDDNLVDSAIKEVYGR